jgi:pimeloyl-ACP methyl ester carboxylesterase
MRPDLKQEIVDAFNENRVPMLMLMGEQDPAPAENIAIMKRDYPNCHGLILTDCGHYIALENPDDFNRAVVNFIAGVRGGLYS